MLKEDEKLDKNNSNNNLRNNISRRNSNPNNIFFNEKRADRNRNTNRNNVSNCIRNWKIDKIIQELQLAQTPIPFSEKWQEKNRKIESGVLLFFLPCFLFKNFYKYHKQDKGKCDCNANF